MELDKQGAKKLTVDNFSSQEEAEKFLRGLRLTVPEAVVRQVVKVVAGEVKSSFHKLYAGNKREGVPPLCGKGTVTKIRKLWQKGRLQPYWDYLGGNPGVGQQSSLKSEAAGTGDSAQVGDGNTGHANDGPKQTQMDWPAVDISVRARLLRDILGKIMEFLKIHCEGNLIILWDEVDNHYIQLLRMLNGLLASPGLEDLQKAVPALPSSLHSMGEDADSEWEYGLRESLSSYKGRILEFCAYIGQPTEDPIFPAYSAAVSNTIDIVLRSFRHQKTLMERKFLADNEKGSSSVPSKSGPTPEALKRGIQKVYKCDATWIGAVLVHEDFPDQIVCDAEVQVFDLAHPKETRCYSWYHAVKGSDHRRPVAVLHEGQVDSPEKAVRAVFGAEEQGKL